jgi:hypothetical protein
MTWRLGRLGGFHAGVMLFMTELARRLVDCVVLARLFSNPAGVRRGVQRLLFGARGVAARLEVVLTDGKLCGVAVGCVFAFMLRAFAILHFAGECLVSRADAFARDAALVTATAAEYDGQYEERRHSCVRHRGKARLSMTHTDPPFPTRKRE